ncbi:MAG: hypothetical protein M1826_002305 [Phylliscum demangeonii]|nr:MAG: hypothetical protein M1826_002305 [Phylliscum demangeonii]
MSLCLAWLLASSHLAGLAGASPGAAPASAEPILAPTPVHEPPTRIKGLQASISAFLGSGGGSGSDGFPTDIAGLFSRIPIGGAAQRLLGVDNSELAALPTQVLNIPGYGNWTQAGWNLRFHGAVYKKANITGAKLDELTNVFLPDVAVKDLPPDQAAQARNVTAEIFNVPQKNQRVSFYLEPGPGPATGGGGGAVTPQGGQQTIALPYPTTEEGDFDAFVALAGAGLQPGNGTSQLQRLNVYATGAPPGNATSYLVPPEGISVVSDVDDILRITRIFVPKDGILNSFARPYVPWMNMPDIYANWSRSIPNIHFHYLTTLPEPVTPQYMDFIYRTYPGGSFDTRPLNFSDTSATLAIRNYLLHKVFETFPKRKFIVVGDTSNRDIMRDYPALVSTFPGQVLCILLRNTTATDPGDHFPYNTTGFAALNQQTYFFFVQPDDLTHLDIANGNCYNRSVPQNLSFSDTQGLPFAGNSPSANNPAAPGAGSGKKSAGHRSSVPWWLSAVAMAAMAVMAGLAGAGPGVW